MIVVDFVLQTRHCPCPRPGHDVSVLVPAGSPDRQVPRVYVGGPAHGADTLPDPRTLTPAQRKADSPWRYEVFNSFYGSANGAWPAGPFWVADLAGAPAPPPDLSVFLNAVEFATAHSASCAACARIPRPIAYSDIVATVPNGPGGPSPDWLAWWASWCAIVDLPTSLARADAIRAKVAAFL